VPYRTYKGETVPIKSWCPDPEEGTLRQAKNMAALPFAFSHACLMPDAHEGYGMPIGGVLAAKNVIIPNAVGVDIGCGMRAVKTSMREIETENLKQIMSGIRAQIPLGFKHHKNRQTLPDNLLNPDGEICQKELKDIAFQIGTLGGGNHFIEIQKAGDGNIWFMIHSGSRNLGKQVAAYYAKKAREINEKSKNPLPKSYDLAGFEADSEIGKKYLSEMRYCLDFARANREKMSAFIKEAIENIVPCRFFSDIDVHHNYASVEKHFGEKVLVHRKGAISAQKGETGIIPGSQGTASYIVKGLGNPDSFCSSSHGAGRKMGRNEARKRLDLGFEKQKLDERGIIHAIRSESDLDEAPGSYKDIEAVMRNQSDLTEIILKLEPLAVIKG
jgi:tRNA-splicing ligase RtcB